MARLKRYPVSVPSGTPVTNVGLRFDVNGKHQDAQGRYVHHCHRVTIFAQPEVEQFVKVRSYGNESISIESELLLDICEKRADLVWVRIV